MLVGKLTAGTGDEAASWKEAKGPQGLWVTRNEAKRLHYPWKFIWDPPWGFKSPGSWGSGGLDIGCGCTGRRRQVGRHWLKDYKAPKAERLSIIIQCKD